MLLEPWKTRTVCLVAMLALAVFALPAAAGSDDEQDVRVKKIVRCEDGDCTETIENLGDGDGVKIVLGDEMNKHVRIHKIKCDGDDCEEHEGMHKTVFVGDGGNVEVMTGDGSHAWVAHAGGHGGSFLGVGLTELTPELREHFGVPADSGVMVSKVIDDSPAFKAGIKVGDVIASVDGQKVAGGSVLGRLIRGHDAGDEVVLNVWRDGAVQSITTAVEERRDSRLHAEHRGEMHDMHQKMRRVMIKCDSDDGDCQSNMDTAGLDDYDCGGAEECEVKVNCEDGDCSCTVNGEDADCAGIPGVPSSE